MEREQVFDVTFHGWVGGKAHACAECAARLTRPGPPSVAYVLTVRVADAALSIELEQEDTDSRWHGEFTAACA